MNLDTLTQFFMWSTVIHGGILVYSTLMILFAPNLIFRVHSKMFSISREQLSAVLYGFLGLYKIIFLTFALVPWLVLLIIQ
ncbi:hypothetical protein HW115_16325 [Verrucomicrobiaceae bacterium N1E253]|uniref:DUF6868 domain-containing protein n=1 Tax=Oceaniferula marina TaxID=2748318 RepID=A0A851GQV1_9BACT|nr:hypothetical protein [Oceaniferula marina]NWK57190.1 hypothetical protein [Oceaniferula marina]